MSTTDDRIAAAIAYCDKADADASRGRTCDVALPWAGHIRFLLTNQGPTDPPTPTPAEMLAAFRADPDLTRLVVNYPDFALTLERATS